MKHRLRETCALALIPNEEADGPRPNTRTLQVWDCTGPLKYVTLYVFTDFREREKEKPLDSFVESWALTNI
jgi:hypothetical protein